MSDAVPPRKDAPPHAARFSLSAALLRNTALLAMVVILLMGGWYVTVWREQFPGFGLWRYALMGLFSLLLVTLLALEVRNTLARGRAEAALRQARDVLEQRVQERTAELAVAVAALQEDNAARRRVEDALRTSEARYRSLVEGIPVALYRTAADGRILDANPALVEMLGYPNREALLAVNAAEFYVNRSDRTTEHDLSRQTEVLRFFETQLRRYDGVVIWVRDTFRAVRDGQGRVLYFEGSMQDMTNRRRLEEELRQSQKMEMVGRLAGGIAHDFSNLLMAILGYAQFARESLAATDPIGEDIEEIIRASRRAVQLTGQLLAFSRRQTMDPQPLSLNDLVFNMDKMLRRLIGENIEVVTLLGEGLGTVEADPNMIEQAIINLAVNARDAMPQGGTLTVETSNVALPQEQDEALPPAPPRDGVMIAISDDGEGMSEETKQHLFEPFYTTKSSGKGTGLGLATVYSAVRQHGGQIRIESELGRGTVCRIYLPRVADREQPTESAAPSRQLPGGSETILVAEDEAAVRGLMCRSLADLGYDVLEAANGAEALRVAAAHAGPLHLLVTDMVMPQLGGKELAAEMGRRYPQARVLFVSGYSSDGSGEPMTLLSGTHFLPKPFTVEILAQRVRGVLDHPLPAALPVSPSAPPHAGSTAPGKDSVP